MAEEPFSYLSIRLHPLATHPSLISFLLSRRRFFDRRDFEYVEMDTDSAYMALLGDLESLVKETERRAFYDEYDCWFPRRACGLHREAFVEAGCAGATWSGSEECCVEVSRFDRRTPGLFKEEFGGDGVVALNSKTYFCWKGVGGGDAGEATAEKYSSKGLNKRSNRLTREHYLTTLRTKASHVGVNRGFVRKRQRIRTYQQLRTGLTYFYGKRPTLADGVTTAPPLL